MKLTDLQIDPKSVGGHLILTAIKPAYAYDNGRRTETIVGHKYEVAMPERAFEKIAVKIEGGQQIDITNGEPIEVAFEGLDLFIYWLNGTYNVGARATAIHIVKAAKNGQN